MSTQHNPSSLAVNKWTWRDAFTEDFPALAEPLVVDRIDHVDDGVAVAVVLGPDGADAALAAEIPELEHCRRQRDLPSCAYIQYPFTLRCPGNAYCSGPL